MFEELAKMLREGIRRPIVVERCMKILACVLFLIFGLDSVKGQMTIVPGKRGHIKQTTNKQISNEQTSNKRKPRARPSVEGNAVFTVRHMPASELDAELPGSSFNLWFNQLVGPKAGVIWQLNECGEGSARQNRTERDLSACVEANAVLADGRQVIVAISVGTFRKGISGGPAFYSAVIEQDGRLYRINRLRNLANLLRAPGNLPVQLPELTAKPMQIKPYSESASISIRPYTWPERLLVLERPELVPEPLSLEADHSAKLEESQAPPGLQKPQKVQEGVLQGRAMVMVKPDYPVHAKSLNSTGSVAVQVIVSEEGRVVDARAISGPLVLREPSVEAARKWVFKPTTFNSRPVKVESILTFVFRKGAK
jgi:Gram-negative bacterial TonB protein C-terminal